jgi:hypothetical protein
MSKPTHENQKQCICIVGRQAVGKSSLEHQIIKAYVAKGGAVVVLAPHPQQFGEYGILCDVGNVNTLVSGLMQSGFKGLVIFDDADAYMNPRSAQVITQLCTTFRHYGIDIVVSSRSLQQININLRRCFTRVMVFQMHEPRSISMLKELLGEFPKQTLKKIPPKEPYVFFDFDMQTYGVVERKTVKVQ